MSIPAELRYTQEHEWVSVEGDSASVGITEYATQQLGDVVYVSLPSVGSAVTAGEPCGEVESVKSVSDLYSPVDGEVTEINTELDDDPSLVNAEPYTAGWMFRVRVAQDGNGDAALPPDLLSAAEYEELTKSAGEGQLALAAGRAGPGWRALAAAQQEQDGHADDDRGRGRTGHDGIDLADPLAEPVPRPLDVLSWAHPVGDGIDGARQFRTGAVDVRHQSLLVDGLGVGIRVSHCALRSRPALPVRSSWTGFVVRLCSQGAYFVRSTAALDIGLPPGARIVCCCVHCPSSYLMMSKVAVVPALDSAGFFVALYGRAVRQGGAARPLHPGHQQRPAADESGFGDAALQRGDRRLDDVRAAGGSRALQGPVEQGAAFGDLPPVPAAVGQPGGGLLAGQRDLAGHASSAGGCVPLLCAAPM